VRVSNQAAVTAAGQAVETMKQLGVQLVFGVPGIHSLALWDAVADADGMRLVGVHHEQTAAYAADGFARATGIPAVCLTTTGPGAANTVAGVGEAWAARSPLIVLASDVAKNLRRPGTVRGSLHECADQPGLFQPVTKARFAVERPQALPAMLRSAWTATLTAPARPVYVGVPADLLGARAEPAEVARPSLPAREPVPAEVERAAAILDQSERIVIWAGGGAIAAGAEGAIAELAERLGAPVVTTHRARGVVPPGHPGYLGLPPLEPAVAALLENAHCLLAFGSDFDGPMTRNWTMPRPPLLVHVNVDPDDLRKNFPADAGIVADARRGAAALGRRCAGRPVDLAALRARLQALRLEVWADLRHTSATADAARFVDTVAGAMPGGTRVVTDMTIPGHWVAHYLQVDAPRRIFTPAWGTLGMAVPMAIGVATACEPVLAIVGDGGFLYAAGELLTIARESLPIVILIVDDAGYGALRYGQTGVARAGVSWESPDFVGWAASVGLPAERVSGTGDDLASALRRAFRRGGPALVVTRASLEPPRTISLRWSST